MHILVATDAWLPQVNGVVRSLQNTAREAEKLGARIDFLTPADFRTVPMPTYPEIRLALATPGRVRRRMDEIGADYVHIATEGPIGIMARRACLSRGQTFTTSYHTRFPEYLAARAPVPEVLSYAWLRRFHNAGAGIMVSTPTLEAELRARGFHNILRWSRGVDAELFRPRPHAEMDALIAALPRPIFLSVGRVAVEKNISAFLDLDLPGSKVVVGDGPARAELQTRHPGVHFLGLREGEALARIYAAADVFVFPSLTDTFGIVLLEALASGLPVAAFPVTGPKDVIGEAGADGSPPVGVLSDDLKQAALTALTLDRAAAREYALRFSWRACTEQFLHNIESAHARAHATACAAAG